MTLPGGLNFKLTFHPAPEKWEEIVDLGVPASDWLWEEEAEVDGTEILNSETIHQRSLMHCAPIFM